LDPSATVDGARTAVMHGFVVYDLPEGNAIDLAEPLSQENDLGPLSNPISFENIPYLSPTCDCLCTTAQGAHNPLDACRAAVADLTPNDPLFVDQWGLQRINAPRAWPLTTGDPNIAVAVLDQGVELSHPDLNLWPMSYSTITHTNDGSPVG